MKTLHTQAVMHTRIQHGRDMLSRGCIRRALEEDKSLCQGGITVPCYPSTCASAASAWESQKVMSMPR
jgi:hypothetical protein